MKLAKFFLGIEYDFEDASSVKRALFCFYGYVIGFLSMLASILNLYLQKSYFVMQINLLFLFILIISFLIARRKSNLKIMSFVLISIFTMITLVSFYQTSATNHLYYRPFMLVILLFYLFKREHALIYSFIVGFLIIGIQLIFHPLDPIAFRYFALAFYVITACIYATGLATVKVEEIFLGQIRRAEFKDSLTGALNIEGLKEKMQDWVSKGNSFSIIMLDIDDFKKVNDSQGHQIGDEYIKNVAKTLTEMKNDQMKFARYGGDEFTIIFDSANESVVSFLTRLQKALSNIKNYPLKVSMGEALYTPGKDLERIIYNADESLYYSKSHGKNCFTRYQDIYKKSFSIEASSIDRTINGYIDFTEKLSIPLLVLGDEGVVLSANSIFLNLYECQPDDIDYQGDLRSVCKGEEEVHYRDVTIGVSKQKIHVFERLICLQNNLQDSNIYLSVIEEEK